MSDDTDTPVLMTEEDALLSMDALTTYLKERNCFARWAADPEILPTIAVRVYSNPELLTDRDCRRLYLDYTAMDQRKSDFIVLDITDELMSSVSLIDILPMIEDFRDDFLPSIGITDAPLEIVILNFLMMSLSGICIDRDRMSSVVLVRLLTLWYPNAHDMTVVVQEVPTEDGDISLTTLKLIGMGSLKDLPTPA